MGLLPPYPPLLHGPRCLGASGRTRKPGTSPATRPSSSLPPMVTYCTPPPHPPQYRLLTVRGPRVRHASLFSTQAARPPARTHARPHARLVATHHTLVLSVVAYGGFGWIVPMPASQGTWRWPPFFSSGGALPRQPPRRALRLSWLPPRRGTLTLSPPSSTPRHNLLTPPCTLEAMKRERIKLQAFFS